MILIAFVAHVVFLGAMAFLGEFSVRPESREAYTVEVVSDGELGGHMPAGLPKLDLGGAEPAKRQLAKQAPPPRPQPAEAKPPPPPEPAQPAEQKPPEPPPAPPEPVKPEPEAPKQLPPPDAQAAAKPAEEGDLIVATATPTAKPTARPTPKPSATPKPTAKPTAKPSASPRPSATPPPRPAPTEAPVKSPRPSTGRSAGPAPKPTLSPPVVVRAQATPAQRAAAEAQRSPQAAPTSASDARIAAALERVQRKVVQDKAAGGSAANAPDAGVRSPNADARGTGGIGGADAPDGNRRLGVGPGRGGAGELRGVEFLLYYNRMLARIRDSWVYTGSASNVEVEVRFRVQDDGTVSDLRVTHASGDPGYDASVLRAVRGASPLGPPPEKYRSDFSDVVLTFQPGDLKKAP
jgi:TonB family protein